LSGGDPQDVERLLYLNLVVEGTMDEIDNYTKYLVIDETVAGDQAGAEDNRAHLREAAKKDS
jgi:hypothetical protein